MILSTEHYSWTSFGFKMSLWLPGTIPGIFSDSWFLAASLLNQSLCHIIIYPRMEMTMVPPAWCFLLLVMRHKCPQEYLYHWFTKCAFPGPKNLVSQNVAPESKNIISHIVAPWAPKHWFTKCEKSVPLNSLSWNYVNAPQATGLNQTSDDKDGFGWFLVKKY